MAGTVAKFVYNPNIGDAPYMNRTTLVGNMEENDVLNHLNDSTTLNKRGEVLEQLRITVRKNGGRLPYANRVAMFNGLGLALGDGNWDVRHQCIQLIHEVIPQFGDDLDMCMGIILPKLVPNMGDKKITIRRSVIQTLHVYMKYTNDVQLIFRAIVKHGLENGDLKIRKETIIALPMLFTPEFSQEDFFEIAQSLAKNLIDTSSDDNISQHSMLSLQKIRNLVGEHTFNAYIQALSAPLRRFYHKMNDEEDQYSKEDNMMLQNFSNPGTPVHTRTHVTTMNHEPWTGVTQHEEISVAPTTSIQGYHGTDLYDFGVVPSHVMDKLNDQTNFRTRAEAVEELRVIIRDLKDVNAIHPYLLQFVSFLNNLLDDPNFKITTVTLEILGLLVDKLNIGVDPHLKPLVLALSKRMGDNKIVVRQAIMKVVRQLMQILSPKPVLAVICENLSHRNSRVRQETLNIIIASLLTFPSYDFDLGTLCQTIAHALVDPKRQVRQACLECYAVLAAAMGAGKLGPLVQAVDSVELSYEGDGVMVAVQARLAKRQLPKLNGDGLVDYATPIPTSASSRSSNVPLGADIEWIMAASGSSGSSARSTRSDILELESVTSSSARSSPASFVMDMGPTPRRHVSAHKGKGRLPWEDDSDHYSSSQNGHSDSQRALVPRSTWSGEQMSSNVNSNGLMRRQTIGSSPSRDSSPETGSYRQMYVNKYKRQQSEGGKAFSVYQEDDDDSALSTPRGGSGNSTWPETLPLDESTNMKTNKKRLNPIPDGAEESDPHQMMAMEDDLVPDVISPVNMSSPVTGPLTSTPTGVSDTTSPPRRNVWSPAILFQSPDFTLVSDSRTSSPYISTAPAHGSSPVCMTAFLARSSSALADLPRLPSVPEGCIADHSSSREKPAGMSFKDMFMYDYQRTYLDGFDSSNSHDASYDHNSHDVKPSRSIEKSPIPTKPALARHPSSKRKVPPIPPTHHDDDMLDGARDSALDGMIEEEEMLNSLRQIRNSATRKIAQKIFSNLEDQSPSTSPEHESESGIFSNSSTVPYDDIESSKQKMKKENPNPFESRPRIARKNSIRNTDNTDSSRRVSESSQHLDFNPLGGVTFRDNPSSDVVIVGRGYGEDSHLSEPKPSSHASHAVKARERRRFTKSEFQALACFSSMSFTEFKNMEHPTTIATELTSVFDPSPSPTDNMIGSVGMVGRDRRPSRDVITQDLPKGVYGVGVKQSLEHHGSSNSESGEEEEEEDLRAMSMSKTTREHMAQKFAARQRSEEFDEKLLADQRYKQEDDRRQKEEEVRRERERQQEKLRRLSNQAQIAEGLTIGNIPPAASPGSITSPPGSVTPTNATNGRQSSTTPTNRPLVSRPSVKKKNSKQNVEETPPSSGAQTPNETDNSSDILKPFKDPSSGLQQALRNMASEDWETKCTGINMLRRCTIHHPDVMHSQLHTITLAVLEEVKNLRSQVSRLAICCLGDMYTSLKRQMDTDLDMTTRVLLVKAGDSNSFIREDVERSLEHMINNVTPQRAMLALITTGSSHRNVAIRRAASMFLVQVVEKMGPGRVLSGIKDITDRILPVAALFVSDGSPETRYNGQRIFYMLMSHEDFDKMLNKHVSATTIRNISDKLETLKRKGLSDPPAESSSARARGSSQGVRSGSVTRGSSASSATSESPTKPSSTPSGKRRGVPRTDEATMEEIKSMCALMGANDWQKRHRGIVTYRDMVDANPDLVGQHIIKIFDKFVACVKDSNSKVNILALQVLLSTIPPLRDYMGSVLSITVQTVASNLSSKNREIYDTASQILDAFMEHIDGALLLQPFANQATSGNARIKPDMIQRVAYLVTQVYCRKPKQVVLHILPLLWSLLGSLTGGASAGRTAKNSGSLRGATGILVAALHQQLGQSLIDQANSNSNVTPKMQQLLQDLIENP